MSILLGVAQTLVAGSILSYCHLSLWGDPLCWWPWRMYHVFVVLCVTVSVSLVFVRFLSGALRCHYVCVWYYWRALIWYFSPCCVYYNCYHCVFVSRRKMLLISWFLNTVVHLSLSVLVGVSLVKFPNVYRVVLTLDLLFRRCLVHIWRINIYWDLYGKYYCNVALLVNVALVALCSVCVLWAMSW